jgi:hypothetical protein
VPSPLPSCGTRRARASVRASTSSSRRGVLPVQGRAGSARDGGEDDAQGEPRCRDGLVCLTCARRAVEDDAERADDDRAEQRQRLVSSRTVSLTGVDPTDRFAPRNGSSQRERLRWRYCPLRAATTKTVTQAQTQSETHTVTTIVGHTRVRVVH